VQHGRNKYSVKKPKKLVKLTFSPPASSLTASCLLKSNAFWLGIEGNKIPAYFLTTSQDR
jgi:hypothetical protein